MQIGESALVPASEPTLQRGEGSVEITVELEALCWDTFDSEGNSGNRPLPGARVSLSTGASADTDENGVARFEGVSMGSVEVTASAPDYRPTRRSISVRANAKAAETLTVRSTRLECSREHTRPPTTGRAGALNPGVVFWPGEPEVWLGRDLLWLVSLLATVLLLVLAAVFPDQEALLPSAAICMAICSYHFHTIFGLFVGVPMMLGAFLVFVALTVVTILAIVAPAGVDLYDPATGSYGLPAASLGVYPLACAAWAGFLTGLATVRRPYSLVRVFVPYALIAAVVGGLIALIVYLVLLDAVDPDLFARDPGQAAGFAIGEFFLGLALGFFCGAFGCVFVNEGNLGDEPNYARTDLALPFTGERYCLQGHRGMFSHYDEGEASYDFVAAQGTPVLAICEGHIVAYREQSGEENVANYVFVRHRDGTTAEYLHLRDGGFRAINQHLVPHASGEIRRQFDDPVHCYAGQQLAESGATGPAGGTPHIHVALVSRNVSIPEVADLPLEGANRDYLPFTFSDGGVCDHGGRCYTMRKYISDSKDFGPVQLP